MGGWEKQMECQEYYGCEMCFLAAILIANWQHITAATITVKKSRELHQKQKASTNFNRRV